MKDAEFTVFTLLEYALTPHHLLTGITVNAFHPYLKIDKDYTLTRYDLIYLMKKNRSIYCYQDGRRIPLKLVKFDDKHFIRLDNQTIPQDL